MKRLKQLEDENGKLKKRPADLSLGRAKQQNAMMRARSKVRVHNAQTSRLWCIAGAICRRPALPRPALGNGNSSSISAGVMERGSRKQFGESRLEVLAGTHPETAGYRQGTSGPAPGCPLRYAPCLPAARRIEVQFLYSMILDIFPVALSQAYLTTPQLSANFAAVIRPA